MASASRQEPVVESQPLTDPGKQDRVHQGVPVVAAFDAYRGVAVLGIVLFHILGVSGVLVKAGETAPAQLVWGTLPYTVFAFFIISGFVMFLPMAARGEFGSIRAFAIRRAARLFPALWAALAICLLLMAVLPEENRSPGTIAFPGLGEILLNFSGQVNWALMFDSGQRLGFGVNPPIWTLTVEIAFYVVLPLVAAFYFRRPWVGLGIAAAIAVGWREAVVHISELGELIGTEVDPQFAAGFQFGDAQLPYWSFAFGCGMTSAWALVRLQSFPDRERLERYALWATGISALVLGASIYWAGHYVTEQPPEAVINIAWDDNLIAIAYTGSLAALMLALAFIPRRLQAPLEHRAVSFLANISYGIYLIHVVLIWAITAVFDPIKNGSIESLLLWFWAVMPAAFLYGWLSARFVEQPIRRWAHRFGRSKPPATAAPEPGGQRAEFDEVGDAYGEAVERAIGFAGAPHELYTRIKADALASLARRHLGDPAGLDVLDVGCGPGETDRLLEGRFRSLTGVDVSAAQLEAAAGRNPWARYARYEEGAPLPFEDAGFDLTFTICVMHHVPPGQWEAFVGEMARVTRPGGMVAVFEHNPWNPLARKVVRDCEFDDDVELLPRRRTRRLLDDAGLEVTESPYIVFFPREGERLRRAERRLRAVPFGAQYYVAALRK